MCNNQEKRVKNVDLFKQIHKKNMVLTEIHKKTPQPC